MALRGRPVARGLGNPGQIVQDCAIPGKVLRPACKDRAGFIQFSGVARFPGRLQTLRHGLAGQG